MPGEENDMRRTFLSILSVFCLACAVVCAGCAGSAPCRFYQLSSLKAERTAPAENSGGQHVILAVGPVRVPDYLDRPQIVTLQGTNELRIAEFDRWAGSLERDMARVLTEDLSVLLSSDRIMVIPWVSTSESATPSLYRVEVNIVRFEGSTGGPVRLKAQWTVFHREKGLLMQRESVISEKVNGMGYGAFVAALSDALAGLGRDIAAAIRSM
jgi:uncharacterized lipoprotein YmbA